MDAHMHVHMKYSTIWLFCFSFWTYLLEWKHLICAEFCTDTHTWLLCTAILVIGLMSDDIWSWFSICSVALFMTLIVPCTEHHSLPFTFNSFDIGLVAEPSNTVCGDVVFHAPSEWKKKKFEKKNLSNSKPNVPHSLKSAMCLVAYLCLVSR